MLILLPVQDDDFVDEDDDDTYDYDDADLDTDDDVDDDFDDGAHNDDDDVNDETKFILSRPTGENTGNSLISTSPHRSKWNLRCQNVRPRVGIEGIFSLCATPDTGWSPCQV